MLANGVRALPRVLFVINSLEGGGAERVMLTLLCATKAAAVDAEYSLALLDNKPRAYEVPSWLTVHQLESRSKLGRSIASLFKLVRAVQPDVIVTFLSRSNVSGVFVGKVTGIPVIISERANTSGHFKKSASGFVAKKIVDLTYPRAKSAIAPSIGVARDLHESAKVPQDRIFTIHNPVDVEKIIEHGARPFERPFEGKYCVAVSRLVPSKNVAMLIRAMAHAPSDLSLAVVGEGVERDNLTALIDELGLQRRVRLLGFMDNPYPIMRSAEFYLSASRGEGFPNSLVEALALELPVIATNCASGPSEILANKEREAVTGYEESLYGILIPNDDLQSMARAINTICNTEIRKIYKDRSQARAREYSVSSSTSQFWKVIHKVIA